MAKRLRFKPMSLKDRLAAFAEDMRQKASRLKSGSRQVELLRKVQQAATATHFDEWADPPRLQPPR